MCSNSISELGWGLDTFESLDVEMLLKNAVQAGELHGVDCRVTPRAMESEECRFDGVA